jgi:hypothetical protein
VNKPMIAIAAVVVAAGILLAWYFHTHSAPPAHVTSSVPGPSPSAPAEPPPVEHPVPPQPAGGLSGPVPALGDSDPALRDALTQVAGSEAVTHYLVPDQIVRHLVVTIDNLTRQKVAVSQRPVVSASGSFMANGDELHSTIDPRNYERYAPLVAVVHGLDTARVADVYLHFYPLFQQVYQDLGYPNGYFNDRLVKVIDSLLATPKIDGPIALTRPNVMYVFADPTLEARPAGQKLLLRMGPENAAVIKAKLKELKALITAAPPPRH